MFSTVQSVFIAMSLYPEVQKRAQAELDVVIGPNRFPDFEDRDMLVYVNALVREALRWQTVLPFALPHRTIEDDEFHGHFIPAGTTLFPNVWYICQCLFHVEFPESFAGPVCMTPTSIRIRACSDRNASSVTGSWTSAPRRILRDSSSALGGGMYQELFVPAEPP